MKTKVKIVYFIMAHKQPELLTKLVEFLDSPEVGFVIHLDKKANQQLFHEKLNKPNCCFIKNPLEIFWGGFSQVKATLSGMQEAVLNFDFTYFVYLSGQDFPIKSNKSIFNFFEQQNGKEFIDYYFIPESSDTFNTRTRIDRYYWMDREEDFFRKAFNKIGSYLKGRKVPYNYKAIGGCAYFGFTSSLINYILNFLKENKKYSRYFKYTVCADEAFFHTLVYNSKFKDAIVKDSLHELTFIQGNSNPEIMAEKDFEKLKASPKLFSRKFDLEIDPNIIKKIEKELLNA